MRVADFLTLGITQVYIGGLPTSSVWGKDLCLDLCHIELGLNAPDDNSLENELNAICIEFEEAWSAGKRPKIDRSGSFGVTPTCLYMSTKHQTNRSR